MLTYCPLVCIFISIQLRQNTFQGVIITDEENQTFAIFTYECGLLEWSDSPASLNQHAVIGYTAPGGFYSSHPLSGTADVTSVSCAACPRSIWSNLVYDLTASTGLPEGPGRVAILTTTMCVVRAVFRSIKSVSVTKLSMATKRKPTYGLNCLKSSSVHVYRCTLRV